MKKVVVIFGGISTEHDVSVISAKSVIKNIDKEKYIVSGVYIDKDGCWYKVDFNKEYEFNIPESICKLENITTYLKDFDVVFPVLHGLYGEDGKIQGMFEMLNIPKVHPHKFRRTMATRAIDKGMPIEQVQKILGHSQIDTTMQYAMVNQSNVKTSHQKYMA